MKGKYTTAKSTSDFSSASNKKRSKVRCVTHPSNNEDNNNDDSTSCTYDSLQKKGKRSKVTPLEKQSKPTTTAYNTREKLKSIKTNVLKNKVFHCFYRIMAMNSYQILLRKMNYEKFKLDLMKKLLKLKKKFEGNLKKRITVHNLEMLKMHKQAKELDNSITEAKFEEYIPFRKYD